MGGRQDCWSRDSEKAKMKNEEIRMREFRERFEVDEVRKHSRGKDCQLVVMER